METISIEQLKDEIDGLKVRIYSDKNNPYNLLVPNRIDLRLDTALVRIINPASVIAQSASIGQIELFQIAKIYKLQETNKYIIECGYFEQNKTVYAIEKL